MRSNPSLVLGGSKEEWAISIQIKHENAKIRQKHSMSISSNNTSKCSMFNPARQKVVTQIRQTQHHSDHHLRALCFPIVSIHTTLGVKNFTPWSPRFRPRGSQRHIRLRVGTVNHRSYRCGFRRDFCVGRVWSSTNAP